MSQWAPLACDCLLAVYLLRSRRRRGEAKGDALDARAAKRAVALVDATVIWLRSQGQLARGTSCSCSALFQRC
jgi:hypothetical protein